MTTATYLRASKGGTTCSKPDCPTIARFRITPTCSHTETDWPTAQACGRHLAAVVTATSTRCTGHQGGKSVEVRSL